VPKYLVQGSYTASGVKGVAKEGGSSRRAAAKELIESMGGTLEALYFSFGDADVYAILDAPDNVSAAAASMAVNASGGVALKTVVLMTAEEMDEASKKSATYRPPGA